MKAEGGLLSRGGKNHPVPAAAWRVFETGSGDVTKSVGSSHDGKPSPKLAAGFQVSGLT